jgi:hypothetical protein
MLCLKQINIRYYRHHLRQFLNYLQFSFNAVLGSFFHCFPEIYSAAVSYQATARMALLQLHFGGFARSLNFEVKKTAVEVETALPEDFGLWSRLQRFIILYAPPEYT